MNFIKNINPKTLSTVVTVLGICGTIGGLLAGQVESNNREQMKLEIKAEILDELRKESK